MKRRGLTLAESVLSLFLVLLVVVLIFQLYPLALASLRGSAQRVQANAWADSLLAEYSARPFSQLQGPQPQPSPLPCRGAILHANVEVGPVSDTQADPDRTRSLRVTIAWEDRGVRHELVREQWRTNVQQ